VPICPRNSTWNQQMISNSTSGIVVLAFGSYEESNLAWTPRTVDSSLGMADLSSGNSAWKKVRFIAIRHLRIPDRPIVLPSRTYVSKEAALARDVLPEEDEAEGVVPRKETVPRSRDTQRGNSAECCNVSLEHCRSVPWDQDFLCLYRYIHSIIAQMVLRTSVANFVC
jgi:hypothetical protein